MAKKKKDTLGHHKKGRKSQNMANNTKPLLCQTSVSLGRKFYIFKQAQQQTDISLSC